MTAQALYEVLDCIEGLDDPQLLFRVWCTQNSSGKWEVSSIGEHSAAPSDSPGLSKSVKLHVDPLLLKGCPGTALKSLASDASARKATSGAGTSVDASLPSGRDPRPQPKISKIQNRKKGLTRREKKEKKAKLDLLRVRFQLMKRVA